MTLVTFLTLLTLGLSISIGCWVGFKLIGNIELRRDHPNSQLGKINIGFLIAGAVALGIWFGSGRQVDFEEVCLGFVLACIAIVIAFRRPKGF